MKIVVYDDSKEFLDFIKNSLDKINTKHGNILGAPVYFSEANEVKEYVSENKEHSTVFLLDIMDEDDTAVGYELAKYIKDIEPCNIVIYVSDFPENYIYTKSVFAKTNSYNVIAKMNENFFYELEETLLNAHPLVAKKVFLAKGKDEIRLIKYEDIIYFEITTKRSEYTKLTYKDGFIYIKDTLSHIKSTELDGNGVFIYSTRNCIVNVRAIVQIKKHEGKLIFTNGESVPFSPRRIERLLECISEL
ncbi:MAG: LytTR family transcriptional regulator DNA-binding domain-containing protein [Defluviitaleaceae bacterium]|nr:LytTR family transcriptional regulator DNA-binding domain-containing protein [Defluviitaleaceae bacterium]